ncbi:hypothetical protein [Streptomyces rubiginosohelvolus]|uniref:hypothetical protein n=1 Tax=Streptomyces rubiginosohelvolus TaxID=67362 RepID=UPI00365CDF6C
MNIPDLRVYGLPGRHRLEPVVQDLSAAWPRRASPSPHTSPASTPTPPPAALARPPTRPSACSLAAHYALTTLLDAPLPTGPRVSTSAARSRSTTTGPDTTAHQQPVPAQPAAPAHHRQTAPAPRQGRGR